MTESQNERKKLRLRENMRNGKQKVVYEYRIKTEVIS